MIKKIPTNIHNLPSPIVRAILNDPYNAGKADVSTTRLINPPQLETLRYRHRDEIIEDVSERIWSLLGQATHTIAERSADNTVISEKRYFAEMEGWTVSGAVDLIEGTTLIDYKVTSVWTYIYGSRVEEWTAQGNVNRWLAYQNGLKTLDKMANILILRDWAKRDVGKRPNYPAVQIVTQPLEMWPIEKAEAYVRERVKIHQLARAAKDEEMPPCSAEERWENRSKGLFMRCEEYCPAKAFCHQFKREPKPVEESNGTIGDSEIKKSPIKRISRKQRDQDTAGEVGSITKPAPVV